jgi:hypothetical protein
MKQMFFMAALLLAGKCASAQTVTINNTTGCTLTILYQVCVTPCGGGGGAIFYTVPPGTMKVPAVGGPCDMFSIFDPCGSGSNTTLGTAPCHSQTVIPYPVVYTCCTPSPTGATWTPATPPATGGTLNIF